ncbi:MAG: TraB/GumN family protein [Saprospirales bacterium]|nr:TraB/GumN family protein [Saprospirales bacterium]MBK8489618.1 TraB/GumN family protein [Saprospirales bacterium]
MKKTVLLGLLTILFTPLAWGQQTAPLEKSLLWEISGNGLKTPSYLYGTIHMIGKEDFFLTDETVASFDKAEQVVFEIDMEKMSNVMVQFSLLMDLFMEDGQTLKGLLSPEDYKLVQTHFDGMGLPMMLLERIKPLFLSVFASGDIDQEGFSSGEVVSYEMEFMEMAQKQDKKIDGLETIEFQMSLFDSIPYRAQAEMLVESIRAEADQDSGKDFQSLVEIYKSQDLEAMQGAVDNSDAMTTNYETMLLSNRNSNWVPVMAKMMPKKSCFFAVGAAHLGGAEGVISLLRKEGYTVRPLHTQP